MKKIILLITTLFLFSCETIENFARDNELLVSIAVRQSIASYIELAETKELKIEKANDVKNVLEKISKRIDESSEIKVSELFVYINSIIEFNKLTAQERLIVEDIFLIISIKFFEEKEEIKPETKIILKNILESAIYATELF
jgi:hypothetical protein